MHYAFLLTLTLQHFTLSKGCMSHSKQHIPGPPPQTDILNFASSQSSERVTHNSRFPQLNNLLCAIFSCFDMRTNQGLLIWSLWKLSEEEWWIRRANPRSGSRAIQDFAINLLWQLLIKCSSETKVDYLVTVKIKRRKNDGLRPFWAAK